MLIFLTIFLFLFTPLVMLILRLVRPRLSIQGFLVVFTVLAGLPMVSLAHSDIPRLITLLQWSPRSLFPLSPSLLIDNTSWFFALALSALCFSIVITSIAQLGQSSILERNLILNDTHAIEAQNSSDAEKNSEVIDTGKEAGSVDNWQVWAVILILTSLGLVAVTAGNLLTLLLAWAALDMIELVTLLGQTLESKVRERGILVFSAKMTGLVTALIAGLILSSHGMSLEFEEISQSTAAFLIVAAGIRLGVLPLQLPFTQGLSMQRSLGTAIRLIPAASSYILLVRASNIGISGTLAPYLLVLTFLAGIYAAINWIGAGDELKGRPYWLVASASLCVGSAILGLPSACLVFSIASLLSGGLLLSMPMRHRNLIPIIALGIFNLSALPFSPIWRGTALLHSSSSPVPSLNILFSILFVLTQSSILAGFIRHCLRGIYPSRKEKPEHVERWVWVLYPIGLIVIVIVHLLIGWLSRPDLLGLPLVSWIAGPIILFVASLILFIAWRYSRAFALVIRPKKSPFWSNLFSLNWLYRSLWRVFRTTMKVSATISSILEGDGGILWALVLFALIFVFLQK